MDVTSLSLMSYKQTHAGNTTFPMRPCWGPHSHSQNRGSNQEQESVRLFTQCVFLCFGSCTDFISTRLYTSTMYSNVYSDNWPRLSHGRSPTLRFVDLDSDPVNRSRHLICDANRKFVTKDSSMTHLHNLLGMFSPQSCWSCAHAQEWP